MHIHSPRVSRLFYVVAAVLTCCMLAYCTKMKGTTGRKLSRRDSIEALSRIVRQVI